VSGARRSIMVEDSHTGVRLTLVRLACLRLMWIATAIFLAAGCGQGDRPPLAPVRGTVRLEGHPLEGGFIVFRPERGRSSSSGIDARGRYELRYVGDIYGAMVGKHTVYIVSATERSPQEKLPARYNTNSELQAMVTEAANTIDFDLRLNP
jgi:hypothetical protein